MEDTLESKVTFTSYDSYTGRYIDMQINALTWIEMTEAYIDFLKGCGFIITAKDVAELFESKLASEEHAIATCEK